MIASPATPRVLLAEPLDGPSEQRLTLAACIVRPPSSDEETLAAHIVDCDALIVRTHHVVSRRVLAAGRRLRVVGVAGVGVERVDLAAAAELGIAVCNTPAAASDAVAEFTVALMLQLLRPIPELARAYRTGHYRVARAAAHGPELRELTIGILGMGRIGTRVGRICSAGLGARVLYHDIAEVGPFPFAASAVTRAELLRASDILTVHVPLTPVTRGLLDAAALEELPPGARLINTARGAVVDTAALTAALQRGRLAGAALDVTDPEPLPAEHPLFGMSNCLLTPHVAARTHGGLARMCAVVDQVLELLAHPPPG